MAAAKKSPQSKDQGKRGRPTLYRADVAERAERLALLGLTDEDLAVAFGVAIDTIYEWKKVHKDFSDALYRGREGADTEVVVGYFKRAKGYVRRIVKTVHDGEKTLTHVTEEEVPPDPGAARQWLHLRQRKRWRDAQEVDVHAGDPLLRALGMIDGATRDLGEG